ncbi:coxsackievirus and adenovirus receptor-like [Channa argus]|uniref:coxsackievirus and adenovirus receptor-like n=1 Tax=Channa argus TaxID=215402 RepID=UPI00352018ED
MKDGDCSVILKSIAINDNGTYECYVGIPGSYPKVFSIVHLKVDPVQMNITAAPGHTVTLPCQVPKHNNIKVAEWIRPDLMPDYVFWYQNGWSDPDFQHQSFKNRVDGDASVILKNVKTDDTGTYKCGVVQRETNQWMSIINLTVNPPEIQAKSGEDVILHCRDPSNPNILVLRWIRPDLKAKGYVYFFRESRSYEQYQYPSFHGRVKLRDPQMKDGDFSVILNHFSINDTGTYECYVGRNNTGSDPEIINIIHLKVKADQEDITAKSGDHVTLPCHVPQNTQILVVEWIRPDLEPEYVFLYKNGQSHPDRQHPSFKNRVELKDSGMKDGNLSVIVKNVTITDTGTYECHIYQSQRNHTMSIINLDVHQPGGDERGGDRDGHVGLIVGLPVVVVVVFAGFMIYGICRRLKQKQLPAEAADYELQDLNQRN